MTSIGDDLFCGLAQVRPEPIGKQSDVLADRKFGLHPAGAATSEATARVEVSIWFQHAVGAGIAIWRMSAKGESEVHFNTGEAYALTAHDITRLERPWPQEDLS